jgi:hypothetical protein
MRIRSAPFLRRASLRLSVVCMAFSSWACGDDGAGSPRDYALDPQIVFWEELQGLCGRAFTGRVVESSPPDEALEDGPLVMHVRSCDVAEVRISFFVGDDRSRTWIVTPTGAGLRLEHEHRHEDGEEDEVSGYGGETRGPGTATVQEFPADLRTGELIPAAVDNVWSLEIRPDSVFVYALRREGTDRRVRVEFDLTRSVDTPPAPWAPDR